MLKIGTSGYSFRDWKGTFYPENLKPADYLAYYAEHFGAVEINATYYGLLAPAAFEKMAAVTPEGFEFAVKANKATTHELDDAAVHDEFRASLAPLREAHKFAGVLAQFPWGFRNTGESRRYLAELAGRYEDLPLFVEFRHDSWDREEVYDFLAGRGLRFVSVDEPQMGRMMPPVARATGDIGYVRFHGRNEKTWWGDEEGDRYDYRYGEDELAPWADKVAELEKSVWKLYAFFNNCHQGYAVRNAQMFRDLMMKRGTEGP